MPRSQRILRVSFASPDAFEREYAANLAHAGVFVATEESLELREPVQVEIVLDFCGRSVTLEGEVVHRIPVQMSAADGTPGVAVQFDAPTQMVRDRLSPLIDASGSFQPEPKDSGRRSAPRIPARVPATIEGDDGPLQGHTRNLSRSGVLVSVPGTGVPVGQEVRLTLVHPTSGRSMDVRGRVVREVRSEGDVSALGIQFDPPAEIEAEFRSFVEGIQSAEHSRRLGGISGSIAELGLQNLLQMFGTTASAGTLTLVHGQREGVIGFERGLLRYARLGCVSGMDALTQLLAWREGAFEFTASLEPLDAPEPPLPLAGAVLEALRQLDEMAHHQTQRFPPEAKPWVIGAIELAGAQSSKVEEAIVELARAGFSVGRIVDVIPEPDSDIYAALESLADRGVIAFSR